MVGMNGVEPLSSSIKISVVKDLYRGCSNLELHPRNNFKMLH